MLTPEEIYRARSKAQRMRTVLRELRRLQRETSATVDELDAALDDIKRSTVTILGNLPTSTACPPMEHECGSAASAIGYGAHVHEAARKLHP